MLRARETTLTFFVMLLGPLNQKSFRGSLVHIITLISLHIF